MTFHPAGALSALEGNVLLMFEHRNRLQISVDMLLFLLKG